MLRIKKNVNLESLKKYGFTEDYNGNYSVSSGGSWIGIGAVNRELLVEVADWYIEEGIEFISSLVYKLTVAGLLEEVGGKYEYNR